MYLPTREMSTKTKLLSSTVFSRIKAVASFNIFVKSVASM